MAYLFCGRWVNWVWVYCFLINRRLGVTGLSDISVGKYDGRPRVGYGGTTVGIYARQRFKPSSCERDLKARTSWLVPERPPVGMRFGLCPRSCVSGNTPWPSLGCFRDKRCSKSTFYIVYRYRLTAFCPKRCQGVLLVRDSSPRFRMECRKIVCRPCFLPRTADGMHKGRFANS